jgi:2'-5' RNA ligase
MNNLLSVYLVPKEKDKEYLDNIIKDLAKKYDSPIFIPHLTLFGDINMDAEELKEAIDRVFENIKPFKIKKTAINQSEAFFKTVFIEFEINDTLKNLFQALSQRTNKQSIDNFKPHISLIYKLMPEEEKLKIIQGLSVKDEYTIGAAYIVAPKARDKDFMDVEGWRILYKKTLI